MLLFNSIRKFSFVFYEVLYSQNRLLPCRIPEIQFQRNICFSFVSSSNRRSRRVKVIQIKPKLKKPIIGIWPNMTVQELAEAMESRPDYIFELMTFVDNTKHINRPQSVISDIDIIKEIVIKAGCKFIPASPPTREQPVIKYRDAVKQPAADPADLLPRPPVVTIMGHVDHGKTTLLDFLRHSSVVDSEFGGITQHIGAFSLLLENKRKITFLDTPGHAAFSAIRERGANVTDIVVLVVAAEDGVMDQTLESMRMAKNAGAVKRDLLKHGIQIEEYGGNVQCIPISALKGININQLTDAILLEADLLNLKAPQNGLMEGVVIESKLDQHRGKISTAIVQRGTLKKGKVLVAGTAWAKVRTMNDSEGKQVKEAFPSDPVEITGWRELPVAGMEILEVESEKVAYDVIKYREIKKMEEKQQLDLPEIQKKRIEHNKEYKKKLELKRNLGRIWLKPTGPRPKEYNDTNIGPKLALIIKGDVSGSVESILNILVTYKSNEICKMELVHHQVGNISENDLELAEAFDAVIYGFNVQCTAQIKNLADTKNISIKMYNVIYHLIDDIKQEINIRLPLKDVEEIIGEGIVNQDFQINEGKKKVHVAGVLCTSGTLQKSSQFRVIRNNETIFEGVLKSLRHLKNNVDSIKKGVECGMQLKNSDLVFEKNDQIICYEIKSVEQVTDWNPGF